MAQATRQQLKRALGFLGEVSALGDSDTFVRQVVANLPGLIASELTTLSVCDLRAQTRRIVSNPEGAISEQERACFDQYIYQHPLVKFHSSCPEGGAWRISDSLSMRAFRRTDLYAEYYERVGSIR